jgi:hypothetical protein
MLSNAFALGKESHQLVSNDAAGMAKTLGAQLLSRTRVTAIDRSCPTWRR